MLLKDVEKLLAPYLEHPGFEQLDESNQQLQEVTQQIRKKMKNIEPHFLGLPYTKIDKETENLIKEFAEICKQHLQ